MPNLIAHLGIASGAAERLNNQIINKNLGPFLLGSVSPDIRIITKNRRDDTHFVDLNFRIFSREFVKVVLCISVE